MAEVLLEKPDGGYGWSSKLGRSLTVPELRTLLILRYEVGIKLDSLLIGGNLDINDGLCRNSK